MRRKNIFVLLLTVTFICTTLFAISANNVMAAGKPYKLKMQISAPAGTPYWDCALDFANSVKSRSSQVRCSLTWKTRSQV